MTLAPILCQGTWVDNSISYPHLPAGTISTLRTYAVYNQFRVHILATSAMMRRPRIHLTGKQEGRRVHSHLSRISSNRLRDSVSEPLLFNTSQSEDRSSILSLTLVRAGRFSNISISRAVRLCGGGPFEALRQPKAVVLEWEVSRRRCRSKFGVTLWEVGVLIRYRTNMTLSYTFSHWRRQTLMLHPAYRMLRIECTSQSHLLEESSSQTASTSVRWMCLHHNALSPRMIVLNDPLGHCTLPRTINAVHNNESHFRDQPRALGRPCSSAQLNYHICPESLAPPWQRTFRQVMRWPRCREGRLQEC